MIEKAHNVILHCTKNYLQNSLNLIDTLNLFNDNLNYYLYTINFKPDITKPNVNIIYFEDDRIEDDIKFKKNINDTNNKSMFISIFNKSKILLHTLNTLSLKEAVYIDSDILPNSNINELFDYFDKITNYPLIQNGLFEFYINYGRGNPYLNGDFDKNNILEYPLMEKLSIPIENRTTYSVSSIIMYNNDCKEFIEEWININETAIKLELEQLKYFFPFSDETSCNVLLWKYKYNNRLPILQMNIDNLENVKDFYSSNYEIEQIVTSFIRIPENKNKHKILFFHGAKNKLSNDVTKLIKNMFNYYIIDNKIYIESLLTYKHKLSVRIYDGDHLEYSTSTMFVSDNKYWYSVIKNLDDFQQLNIKIIDNYKLIFNVKIQNVGISINTECFGDTLNSTPIIRELSKSYNSKVIVYNNNPEIFINNPFIEKVQPLNDEKKCRTLFNVGDEKIGEFQKHIRKTHLVDYFTMDLGFTLTPNEKHLDFYPDDWSNFIDLPNEYICINPSKTWPSKTWYVDNWNKLVTLLSEYTIIILGSHINYNGDEKSFLKLNNNRNVIDLTNKTTISDAWYIINNSKMFITMDSGLLHLGGTTDAKILQLGSSIEPFSKAPYRKGTQHYKYSFVGGECKLFCGSNLKYSVQHKLEHFPVARNCIENFKTFECHPTPETVYEKILEQIKN